MAVNVLGFAGSLREKSLNKGLLRTAGELLPDGMTLEIFDLGPIPLYNEDVLAGAGFPAPVQELRDKIAAADALLIAMPEYNYSMTGVLKNAIDWASRPPDQPNEKPVAVMGATPGGYGTTRAQHHFRQCAVFLNMRVVNKPDVAIPAAGGKFDDDGRLTDEASRGFVAELLQNLNDWTLRLG